MARMSSVRGVQAIVLALCLAAMAFVTGAGGAAAEGQPAKRVFHPLASGVSLPLSALPVVVRNAPDLPAVPLRPRIPHKPAAAPQSSTQKAATADTALQTSAAAGPRLAGQKRFAGIGFTGYYPSDANIAVGKTSGGGYIVQGVNTSISIYNKSGTRLQGPVALKSLWSSIAGSCATYDGSDPVILYDAAADRWVIAHVSYDAGFSNNYECIAVSRTSDPRGAYNLYSYSFGATLNDFDKLSVWATASNSAFLATYNLFGDQGNSWGGGEICAYDRQAMLSGAAAATAVCFTSNGADLLWAGGFLPADADGPTPPAEGPLFLSVYNETTLFLYQLTGLDFTTSGGALVPSQLAISPFTFACASGPCIPQKGTTQTLDALGDRLNYRLAYRVFSDHAAMVVTHPAAVGSSVGLRWYELRRQTAFDTARCDGTLAASFVSGSWSLCQQGTYAPDANFRWMGSAAMDGAGNIALGYSLSSSTLYPSIAFAVRTPDMPPGTLGAETVTTFGQNYQSSYSRWGDYTSLRIDPDDDRTFWYVNQYYSRYLGLGWLTAINAFSVNGGSSSVAFSAATYSVSEGAGSVTITAQRSSSSGTASVSYATANGTATAGSDYSAKSGTLTFQAGATTASFNVPIINDLTTEGDETFTVSLSSPSSGLSLGSPSTATVTITDDDSGTTNVTPLQNGVAAAGLSGATGSKSYFSIAVPAGTSRLTITTSGGSGNLDLYARLGSLPTTTSFGCRSRNPGNSESCVFRTPAVNTYYIMLNAVSAFSGVSLTASYQ